MGFKIWYNFWCPQAYTFPSNISFGGFENLASGHFFTFCMILPETRSYMNKILLKFKKKSAGRIKLNGWWNQQSCKEYCWNKRPMGHIAHLRKQFKSLKTYDYIIKLIKKRKKKLHENWLVLHLKDAFCQVWKKLAQCFWRRGFFLFCQCIFAIS